MSVRPTLPPPSGSWPRRRIDAVLAAGLAHHQALVPAAAAPATEPIQANVGGFFNGSSKARKSSRSGKYAKKRRSAASKAAAKARTKAKKLAKKRKKAAKARAKKLKAEKAKLKAKKKAAQKKREEAQSRRKEKGAADARDEAEEAALEEEMEQRAEAEAEAELERMRQEFKVEQDEYKRDKAEIALLKAEAEAESGYDEDDEDVPNPYTVLFASLLRPPFNFTLGYVTYAILRNMIRSDGQYIRLQYTHNHPEEQDFYVFVVQNTDMLSYWIHQISDQERFDAMLELMQRFEPLFNGSSQLAPSFNRPSPARRLCITLHLFLSVIRSTNATFKLPQRMDDAELGSYLDGRRVAFHTVVTQWESLWEWSKGFGDPNDVFNDLGESLPEWFDDKAEPDIPESGSSDDSDYDGLEQWQ